MECYIFYQHIHHFQSLRIGLIIIKAAALAFWVFCYEELDYFLVGMYHVCLVLPDSHKNTWRLSNEEIKGYLNLSVQQNIKSRLMSPPALFLTQSGLCKHTMNASHIIKKSLMMLRWGTSQKASKDHHIKMRSMR